MGCSKSKPKKTLPTVSVSKTKQPAELKDYELKVLLIGDSGVGKSSLLLRFTDNSFTDSFISTIGVDFKKRVLDIEGKKMELSIWDTAGQERFRTITSSYYRGAHGLLVCFDITNPETFNNLQKWLQEIDRYASDSPTKIVVGCKSDLEMERKVTYDTAKELCDQLNLEYVETSSKNSTGVDDLFVLLATRIVQNIES